MNGMAVLELAVCPSLGAMAGWVAGRLAGQPLPRRTIVAATAALPVLSLWSMTALPSPEWPQSLLLAWALVVLALVDMADWRLPDSVTMPLTAAGLLLAFQGEGWGHHWLGTVLGWAAPTALAAGYRRWRRRDGLGQGDAKLLAAAGAWLGWQGLPTIILTACAAAILAVAAIRVRSGRFDADTPLPFGPPLCIAFWLAWLYGPLGG